MHEIRQPTTILAVQIWNCANPNSPTVIRAENSLGPEGAELTHRKPNKAKGCRLQRLFDAAERDHASARMQALEYIRKHKPEHAEKLDYILDDAGNHVPHIQLPCIVPRINPETGNVVGNDELPFLYVVNGAHGRHLFSGQDYRREMAFTKIDQI